MRTRLLAAMTALLAMPFLSAAADASQTDHKCDTTMSAEHKCEKGGKG